MNCRALVIIALITSMAAACDRPAAAAAKAPSDSVTAVAADSLARARQDSINRAQPGYIIDSLLPIEEHTRRFRAAIGGTAVTSLVHASPSRDSLFRRFVRAVERRDTAAFRDMLISAREFIDLVYPESPFSRPPYRHPPGLLWGQMQMSSAKGSGRLFERRGGQPLRAIGMACADTPNREGRNLIWTQCQVRIRDADGGEHREQLFGGIIERAGRFKFLSYANQY